MTWALIIIASHFAGNFGHADSIAVTSVPGFTSQVLCEKAAQQTKKAGSTAIDAVFCVQQAEAPSK